MNKQKDFFDHKWLEIREQINKRQYWNAIYRMHKLQEIFFQSFDAVLKNNNKREENIRLSGKN